MGKQEQRCVICGRELFFGMNFDSFLENSEDYWIRVLNNKQRQLIKTENLLLYCKLQLNKIWEVDNLDRIPEKKNSYKLVPYELVPSPCLRKKKKMFTITWQLFEYFDLNVHSTFISFTYSPTCSVQNSLHWLEE